MGLSNYCIKGKNEIVSSSLQLLYFLSPLDMFYLKCWNDCLFNVLCFS